MEVDLERIAAACAVECHRQEVGLDGLARLIEAYSYAVSHANRPPEEADVLQLAAVIEPSTAGRYRTTPVTFHGGGSAADHAVADQLRRAWGL